MASLLSSVLSSSLCSLLSCGVREKAPSVAKRCELLCLPRITRRRHLLCAVVAIAPRPIALDAVPTLPGSQLGSSSLSPALACSWSWITICRAGEFTAVAGAVVARRAAVLCSRARIPEFQSQLEESYETSVSYATQVSCAGLILDAAYGHDMVGGWGHRR